jgi:uncharacterized protein (TIGR00251 family)
VLSIVESSSGVAFWIHVTPRSRREKVRGTHGDALKVHVTAAPVDGAANAACVAALAGALAVRRRDVEMDPASKGRRKRVRINGDPGALGARIRELAAGEDGQ